MLEEKISNHSDSCESEKLQKKEKSSKKHKDKKQKKIKKDKKHKSKRKYSDSKMSKRESCDKSAVASEYELMKLLKSD